MNFVIYNTTSGEIHSYGHGDVPTAPDGMAVLEDCPGTYLGGYVKNGVYTPYTTAQAAAKAVPCSFPAVWDNTTFSWMDIRTLAEAKADTWDAIRTARDQNQAAGFMWSGSKFDSDDTSVQRIQGAVQLAILAQSQGQAFSIVWTLYDNTTRTLSGSDMINVFITLGVFVQTIFTQGVNLRNQIEAASNISDLHSITWQTIS